MVQDGLMGIPIGLFGFVSLPNPQQRSPTLTHTVHIPRPTRDNKSHLPQRS
jgi:hypothetical protein